MRSKFLAALPFAGTQTGVIMIHKNTLPMGWRLQTPRLPSSKPATRNSLPKSTAETKSPWACKMYKRKSS